MTDSSDYAFARESYAAIERSSNPILRSCSAPWRNKIASWVLAEWPALESEKPDRRMFQITITKRVNAKIRKNVGFVWLPIALFVAQIIIKILIERWFHK